MTRSSHVNNNLRKILSYCKEVKVQYRLARDLDLTDVMNDLLTADGGLIGAVIEDTYNVSVRS